MGLDKWLKPEVVEKKLKKKRESHPKVNENNIDTEIIKPLRRISKSLKKYILVCPNAKCKYQKTIMKKQLTKSDEICPRCNKKMKLKEK
ncbi:hypothetical protein LCGC14_1750130 [marine sediment metagenome]|uniref:Uncharacterized protein n=1 Tax=marine sediment metagenome TaxID=412755 RepID=A0A0F9H474_9ZZZZ